MSEIRSIRMSDDTYRRLHIAKAELRGSNSTTLERVIGEGLSMVERFIDARRAGTIPKSVQTSIEDITHLLWAKEKKFITQKDFEREILELSKPVDKEWTPR